MELKTRARWGVPAPAKLNLFLHVTGRRADGYHLLESLMVLLDFGDRIALEVRDDGVVTRLGGYEGVPEDDDLAVRAARLLKERSGSPLGAGIAVEKRIPIGGGLGGGSSDAASVLLALNRLWGLSLSRAALAEIGLALGADVPFFVFGESALVSGIGERMRAVSVPPSWYVVLVPPETVPTARVFASPKLTRDSASATIPLFPEGFGRNDLQDVATGFYPTIAERLAWLARFAPARMTGSGSCVTARFASEAAARAVLARMPPESRGFVARLVPRHPLWGCAGDAQRTGPSGLPLGSRQAG